MGYVVSGGGAGPGPQASTVEADPQITTTSSTYIDLTDMSITITTGANDILLIFDAMASSTVANDNINVVFGVDAVDETEQHSEYVQSTTGTGTFVHSQIYTATAASHTFKVRWRRQTGTGTIAFDQRKFIVIELR